MMYGSEDKKMNSNNTSVFPEHIDSRSFMSDIDLEHLDLLQQYQNLLRRKEYNKASDLLEKYDSFYYGASLFNMLEDRLYKIGQYLFAKDKQPLGFYQTDVPAISKRGTSWIA